MRGEPVRWPIDVSPAGHIWPSTCVRTLTPSSAFQMGRPKNTPQQDAAYRERECACLGKWKWCVRENGATVTLMEKGQYCADLAVWEREVAWHREFRQERAITLIWSRHVQSRGVSFEYRTAALFVWIASLDHLVKFSNPSCIFSWYFKACTCKSHHWQFFFFFFFGCYLLHWKI